MATTASSPPHTRTPSAAERARASAANASSSSSPIPKGATARAAAASPRISSSLNSSVARRPSVKGPSSQRGVPAANGDAHDALADSLKHETEEKEKLMVQVQNNEQTIAGMVSEMANLTSAISAAETRLNEMYADQGRMEEEMAARIEVAEKLRTQVRELEKEKRDILRRYNEQTSTFEAERQAFYDNEQHLKSRIQSLTQARKQQTEHVPPASDAVSEADPEEEEESQPQPDKQSKLDHEDDTDTEPAEMTSLRLELSTLSTSYNSLQSTLVLLQTQLNDVKRVNHELQEENESYMILLREKTLSGQFDVMRQVGNESTSETGDDDDESVERGSLRSTGRSTLDRVDEEANEDAFERELERSLQPQDDSSPMSDKASRSARPQVRRQGSPKSQSPQRGESLANLPITGPGLDLAAELGRAENKDILEGDTFDERDRPAAKGKRGKKSSTDARKVADAGEAGTQAPSDVDALRNEVKNLKDANKALSLYASKIIDRIISQEGFEHVLAADFDKSPTTPKTPGFGPTSPEPQTAKPRPQSTFFSRATGAATTASKADKRSTMMPSLTTNAASSSANTPAPSTPSAKANRRSMSFDWKNFSMFGGTEKKPELRPLTLKPGSVAVTGARKLETQEDEEDRRERERLNATMKLMGIEPPTSPPPPSAPPMQKSVSNPTSPPTQPSRFSFFRSRSANDGNSDTSSVNSTPSLRGSTRGGEPPSSLTQEALEQAEAENSLAALDAREKELSAEISKGAGSGFTEIARRTGEGRRSSRRSRLSGGGSGSGSTVWSAGMSGEGGDE